MDHGHFFAFNVSVLHSPNIHPTLLTINYMRYSSVVTLSIPVNVNLTVIIFLQKRLWQSHLIINIIFRRWRLVGGRLCVIPLIYIICVCTAGQTPSLRVILADEVPRCVADTLNRVRLSALPHSYSQ